MLLDRVVEAHADFLSLLSYDSIWTGFVDGRDEAIEGPLELFEAGLAFRRRIRQAVYNAQAIAEVAEAGGFSDPPDSLRDLLVSDEPGLVAVEVVDQHEGVAGLARTAVADLSDAQDDELRRLEADARKALTGQMASGLFGDRFLCGLAKASMAAGLITVWIPPHAHAAAAVALGATAYKAGKCAGPARPPHPA